MGKLPADDREVLATAARLGSLQAAADHYGVARQSLKNRLSLIYNDHYTGLAQAIWFTFIEPDDGNVPFLVRKATGQFIQDYRETLEKLRSDD